jgi:hypothetical protein
MLIIFIIVGIFVTILCVKLCLRIAFQLLTISALLCTTFLLAVAYDVASKPLQTRFAGPVVKTERNVTYISKQPYHDMLLDVLIKEVKISHEKQSSVAWMQSGAGIIFRK